MEHFTVPLQGPFSYPLFWIVLAGVLLLGAGVLTFFALRTPRPKKEKPVPKPTLDELKVIYTNQLRVLSTRINAGELDLRHSYAELSRIARSFAGAARDLSLQNYTLSDLKRMPKRIPSLINLVDEAYEPEFAEKSSPRELKTALKNTARIIRNWRE